jgi:hypothetical protein
MKNIINKIKIDTMSYILIVVLSILKLFNMLDFIFYSDTIGYIASGIVWIYIIVYLLCVYMNKDNNYIFGLVLFTWFALILSSIDFSIYLQVLYLPVLFVSFFRKNMKVMGIIFTVLATLFSAVAIFFNILIVNFGISETDVYDGMNEKYYLEKTVYDHGALGGSTSVTLYETYFKILSKEKIRFNYSYNPELKVEWIDMYTFTIDGKEYFIEDFE